MQNRQEQIRSKGFDMLKAPTSKVDSYAKLKIGTKAYGDAVLDLENYKQVKKDYCGFFRKGAVIKALIDNDIPTLRAISRFFYKTNGIYQKVVNYFATMYRYDWYMAVERFSTAANEDKIVTDFVKTLSFFDNSYIKKACGEIALRVIRDGIYYGYAYEGDERILIQDLPWKYCRSRFKIMGMPAIEFDMTFFDSKFPNVQRRMQVLDLFPPEFKKGYLLYKQNKLPQDDPYELDKGKGGHWYLLDPGCAFQCSITGLGGLPLFINAIPALIDLDTTQGIDRQRQLQQLLKIIVQKLPLDKNGDLIFDVDEARDIHNNAVEMLRDAIGVDVLTTFADIEGIEVSDANATVKNDSLDNAERTVYNALGVSKNIFNTDGNLALEKSILADEGTIRDLVLQFELLFDRIAQRRSASKKKWNFRFYMLHTTQYNYQALSKLYKEQTQMGFSKMLPQIALGQSQSFILNTVMFENDILHLSEIMIPPLMSSTLNAQDLQSLGSGKQSNNTETQKSTEGSGQNSGSKVAGDSKEAGRPAKEDGELSEKTIKNKESMS